jgi:hypothetical protein
LFISTANVSAGKIMSRPYVLPNRKAFADAITRVFMKYREKDKDPLSDEDKDVDLCMKQTSGNTRELFPYQKIIRDYLKIETPYRGILVYHGLGSGKTCSSIAVAESLLTTSKVYVMVPASLEANYREEILKCGDPVYALEQNWIETRLTEENRTSAKNLGISDKFLDKHQRFFTTVPGGEANFVSLPKNNQGVIREQIKDVVDQRFHFIRYNGLSKNNIEKYIEPGMYDDSVVIIDEVHNLISSVINESEIKGKLYDAIYHAKRCKVVALSGTPVINRPNEISYLMNLLRGPIERITIPFKSIATWDEEKITKAFRQLPETDTIEFNALKKYVMVTRNPPQFRSTFNGDGERIAVQYMKDMPFIPQAGDWVTSIKANIETEVGGAEIASERVTTEEFTCLPTNYEEFAGLFLDGLNIKNPMLFRRRIQGLVSYFKGADERLVPRRVDDEHMLEKVPMSTEQFTRYLEVRWMEMKIDSRRNRSSLDDDLGTYRVPSRLACNYIIPPDLRVGEPTGHTTEESVPDKEEILKRLRANPERFLSEKALKIFSPKLLRILQNVKESGGNNQFVYSQYRSLEGLGVFSAILDAAGWQPYKIVKQAGQWVESPDLQEKPAYAFYTGEENVEERDLTRQIFNGVYSKNFPASLKESVEKRGKKILTLLMASSSGAEGITLANVRHVHIMEPHWTPARHDQVIGRAIRICSHATLPMEERTVKISFYVSVFTADQEKSAEFPNIVAIRRNDTSMRRYEGQPVEAFMSTDEYLYETAYEKERISQKIGLLLKEAAVDCEIHRKLHAREKPLVSCMRFDSTTTGEDLAFKPNIKTEDTDETINRNTARKHRRLQKVLIKGLSLIIDPDTKEVFDGPAWDDNKRLLRMGELINSTSIRFLL